MEDNNKDIYNENYNIEDTGKLLTQASHGGKKKRLILLISAAAAVIIVAVVASYFVISDKKYEDQIAIANKAFVDGNYAQAEAEFLKAVDMNKRETKAKEGLAYIYALEGKFDDSAKVYEEVYKKTKEEKHKKAIEAVQNKQLPSDIDLVPAKDIWRSLPTEQVGYYDALNRYILSLEEDYFYWSDVDSFDCDNADGFPVLQMLMTGTGYYDISIEDYTKYIQSNSEDESMLEPLVKWQRGSDPRNWVIDSVVEDEYVTADADSANKLLKEVFNVSDEVIEESLKESESYKNIYLDNGTYYAVEGWNHGTYGSAIELQAIWSDGNKYCVEYYGGHVDEDEWDEYVIDRSEPYDKRYALIEPKLIDDEHYWSLYYVGPEMPASVKEGLQSAASQGTSEGTKSLDDWESVDAGSFDEYDSMSGFFAKYHIFSGPVPFDSRSAVQSDILAKLTGDIWFVPYTEYPINNALLDGDRNGLDPRGWVEKYGYMLGGEYDWLCTDQGSIDWIAKNVFNVSDDDMKQMLDAGEKDHRFYADNGKYYYIAGTRTGVGAPMDPDIKSIRKSGSNYYIEYSSQTHLTSDQTEVDLYALLSLKEESGTKYWSVYYIGTESPEDIDGFDLP